MGDVAAVTTITEKVFGTVKMITFEFTSGEGAYAGAASAATTKAYDGEILQVMTDPGSTAPSDNWDLTITDPDSIDLLKGNGADRDTATTEYIVGSTTSMLPASGLLTFNVTNAGDQKTGTVYVWIR